MSDQSVYYLIRVYVRDFDDTLEMYVEKDDVVDAINTNIATLCGLESCHYRIRINHYCNILDNQMKISDYPRFFYDGAEFIAYTPIPIV